MRSNRDVQIHMAVTIMANANNVPMIGEKDNEITQLCVQLDARHAPFREKDVRQAFIALGAQAIDKMRRAGLTRP
jgi:hypothetical protein